MKLTDGPRTAAYLYPKGVRIPFTASNSGATLTWTDGEIYEWTEHPGWYMRVDGTVVHWIYFCNDGTSFLEYHSGLETMAPTDSLRGSHSPN